MEEKSDNNGEITGKDPINGRFLPGNKLGGKTPGSKDYLTLYWEAITKIANDNQTTPEDMEGRLYRKGVAEAITGDYRFYKDVLDRKHGTAPQVIKQDINIKEDITDPKARELAEKYEEELKKSL